MNRFVLFAATVGFTAIAQASQAAGIILSPVSATASSTAFGSDIGNTIDQSGLSAGFNSGVDDFDDYIASNPTHTAVPNSNEWFAQFGVTSATIDYDLGQVFEIDRFALWNNDGTGLGLTDVSVSVDGVTFTTVLNAIQPQANPIFQPYSAEVFDFSTIDARFVRLATSNCPVVARGVSCSIGEVAFSAVPEPFTIIGSLAAIGFGAAAKRKMAK